MNKTHATVQDILKKEGIYHFQADQTLSMVLPKLSSSHDAAFVFDQKDTFLGVISPYSLFKSRSFRGTTKLRNAAKMPPKLDPQDSLRKVAQAMIDSKIYFLPVLAGKTFLGIATITRLLQCVVEKQLLNGHGQITFSQRSLYTVLETAQIDQAMALMREQKVAKLPVLNSQGKMVGIVSQYDSKNLVREVQSLSKGDRVGEKQSRTETAVTDYMTRMVETVDRVPSFAQAVNQMLSKGIGSLVIVDKHFQPLGIVTKRDLLQTIAQGL